MRRGREELTQEVGELYYAGGEREGGDEELEREVGRPSYTHPFSAWRWEAELRNLEGENGGGEALVHTVQLTCVRDRDHLCISIPAFHGDTGDNHLHVMTAGIWLATTCT